MGRQQQKEYEVEKKDRFAPSIPQPHQCWSRAPIAHFRFCQNRLSAARLRFSASQHRSPQAVVRSCEQFREIQIRSSAGRGEQRADQISFRARTDQPGELARSSILIGSTLHKECAKCHFVNTLSSTRFTVVGELRSNSNSCYVRRNRTEWQPEALAGNGFETGSNYCFASIPDRMTSVCQTTPERLDDVLNASEGCSSLRRHVLQEDEASARFQHAPDLLER